MMGTVLKRALLVGLVFAMVWAGAIIYWRETDSNPDNATLLVFLLLVPLGIVLLLWLGRFLVGRLAAVPALTLATDAQTAPAQASAAPSALPPLVLVASALRVPHGQSAKELVDALVEHRARPALDPDLVDSDGFPIMSARVAGADDPAHAAKMCVWLARQGWGTLRYDDEQWRAISLACSVTTALAQDLLRHRHLHPDGAPATLPMLQLLMLWQAGWSVEQRSAAAGWLRELVVSAGWPRERITLEPELAGDPSTSTPAALLARLARQREAGVPLLAMVIACGSHISEASANNWAARNALQTPTQGQGRLPGEGAAALLLTDPVQAVLLDHSALVMLHSVEGQRGEPIDSNKRTDVSVLRTLTDMVLANSATKAGAVAMIVADTGTRINRVMETMGLAQAVAPELDTADELLQVGAASGTCGAVPFLTVLALAAHQTAELGAPVLCLSNEDPLRRCAALLWPAALAS